MLDISSKNFRRQTCSEIAGGLDRRGSTRPREKVATKHTRTAWTPDTCSASQDRAERMPGRGRNTSLTQSFSAVSHGPRRQNRMRRSRQAPFRVEMRIDGPPGARVQMDGMLYSSVIDVDVEVKPERGRRDSSSARMLNFDQFAERPIDINPSRVRTNPVVENQSHFLIDIR